MCRFKRHFFYCIVLQKLLSLSYKFYVTVNKKEGSLPDQSLALLPLKKPRTPFGIPCHTVMIRVNAKLGKIISCKISDIDLFNASLSLVDLSEEICSNPKCHAKGCCRMHASYTRDIISFYHGKRQESQVVIPRVYCESCGKTHALIPEQLIPYGSYSIRFILAIIYVYSQKKYTIEKLCERYSISVSTLYTWLKLFKDHFNSWFSVMEQIISVSTLAIQKIYSYENFPSSFFKRFNFSFLQLRKATPPNLSPPD